MFIDEELLEEYKKYNEAFICNFNGTITVILAHDALWYKFEDQVFKIYIENDSKEDKDLYSIINKDNFVISFTTTDEYSAYEQAVVFCDTVYNGEYILLNEKLNREKERIKSLKNNNY